jgi:hypothetical protein
MVERHSSADAGAAIVPYHAELAEAQVFHDLDTIERHGTLGLLGMVGLVGGPAGIAVATQVA